MRTGCTIFAATCPGCGSYRFILKGEIGSGNTGATNRAKVRSAIRAEAESQGMSPADVATTIAEFEGLRAGERTLGQVGARADRAVAFLEETDAVGLEDRSGLPFEIGHF